MDTKLKILILIMAIFCFSPQPAGAVPPPEIANQTTSIMTIIASIVSIFPLAIFLLFKFVKKYKFIISLIALLSLSALIIIYHINKEKDKTKQVVLNQLAQVISVYAADFNSTAKEKIAERVNDANDKLKITLAEAEELIKDKTPREYFVFNINGKDPSLLVDIFPKVEIWPQDKLDDREYMLTWTNKISSTTICFFYCDFGYSSRDAALAFSDFHKNTYYIADVGLVNINKYAQTNDNNFLIKTVQKLKGKDAIKLVDKNKAAILYGGGAIIIDPRSYEEYEKKHFPLAANIPFTKERIYDLLEQSQSQNGFFFICYNLQSCRQAALYMTVISYAQDFINVKNHGIYILENKYYLNGKKDS